MSETATEQPKTKTPSKNGEHKPKGKENIFTKQYGPLYGWVWLVIIGGIVILVIEYRKRKEAANSTTSTDTSDTTSDAGSGYDTSGDSFGSGGSVGGYYGGSSTAPAYPNPSGTGTAVTATGQSYIVADVADENIAKAAGINVANLFYSGKDPYASKPNAEAQGYNPPSDLPTYSGQANPVYLGLAQQVAPPGSTVIAGADRNATQQDLKEALSANAGESVSG